MWLSGCRLKLNSKSNNPLLSESEKDALREKEDVMGLMLVFAAGYVMGSRAGSDSLDDVVDAVHAIRKSEEFHDFVSALRTHAAHSLRGLATMLDQGSETSSKAGTSNDLLERVRLIVGSR